MPGGVTVALWTLNPPILVRIQARQPFDSLRSLMAYGQMKKEANVLSVVEGQMPYFIYIIRTKKNQLYVGQSNRLERRELEHQRSKWGAKFLRDSGTTFDIAYTEEYPTRKEAMKREKQLKGWTRVKKEALIKGNLGLLKKL